MPQVLTAELTGGTIIEVTFPSIGKRLLIFGKTLIDPSNGKVLINQADEMLFLARVARATCEFLPFLKRRAREWAEYERLIALSQQGKFSEALDLALKVAKA